MIEKIFASIDIGTTVISVLAAEVTETGGRITGSGTAPSRGLRKGVVVNIEEAAHSVRSAVSEAEAEAGRKIPSAVVGIAGQHINGFLSRGLIGLQGREITAADRLRSIESAKTMYMPLDREVLHVIPTEFILDGQSGITDPTGMSGVRLESLVHILTAYQPAVQNLAKTCEMAGLEVLDMVFGPLATAVAVLTPEEIEQGTLLVDIGGGTTDIAFFRHEAMVHASVLGIGGLHVTNDIAIGLKVCVAEAERIKKTAGLVSVQPAALHETIKIAREAGEPEMVSRQLVAAIIQPRCEELFEKVREEVIAFGVRDAAACSLVLTGGTALLNGIADLAASILAMPVRVGLPHGMPGMKNSLRTPSYAAATGLAAYRAQREVETARLQNRTVRMLARVTETVKNVFGHKDFLEIDQKKKKGVSYV